VKTIQITLDEDLFSAVQSVVEKLGISRSAFTRTALKEALRKARAGELERRHREGYARKPVNTR
jgi:metal-responsive CopG/Arc/MetJ family transcriptional regulator